MNVINLKILSARPTNLSNTVLLLICSVFKMLSVTLVISPTIVAIVLIVSAASMRSLYFSLNKKVDTIGVKVVLQTLNIFTSLMTLAGQLFSLRLFLESFVKIQSRPSYTFQTSRPRILWRFWLKILSPF